MKDPSLSVASANALESISSSCRAHLTSHFDVLLQVVDLISTLSINTETAVCYLMLTWLLSGLVYVKGVLSFFAKVRVVRGVTKVCCRLNVQHFTNALLELCKIHAEPLRKIASGEDKMSSRGTGGDPVYWLDRLAAIFRNVSITVVDKEQVHPSQPVVTYVWPVLSATLERFQTDRRVMERCCRCLRFALRLIGQQSSPFLVPLVTQVFLQCCSEIILQKCLLENLSFNLLDGVFVCGTPPQLLPLPGQYSGGRVRRRGRLCGRPDQHARSTSSAGLPAAPAASRILPASRHGMF